MLQAMLWVGLGGAGGSILRYLIQRNFNFLIFPYGTLAVNVLGCFCIGLLWAAVTKNAITENTRLLLMTGFCGGFTTFSALTYESLLLVQGQRWLLAIVYISVSVVAGVLATFAGYKLIN